MAFCVKCGLPVPNVAGGAKFCAGCGTPIVQIGGPAEGSGVEGVPAAYPTVTPSQPSASINAHPLASPSSQSQAQAQAQARKGSVASNKPPVPSRPDDGKRGNAAANAKVAIDETTGEPLSETERKVNEILNSIKRIYKNKILPLESVYKFDEFHSPSLTDTDFDAKPMVLLLGQYSTGKTTFIRYLVERDYQGIRIGPEPTTDRFTAIMYGKLGDERVIPGNALAHQTDKPFQALKKFGMGFLNKFECSQCCSPILEKITFIDTPGVLSGEKQRLGRSYEFASVVEWFAERCDRILLLFDAHKLDISDEFKVAISCLKGHDDKIRVVLNKADQVDAQQLMRVYGALMWSLGKVMGTPEVPRVYIGSFWDQPLKNKDNQKLLEAESRDLISDLKALPRNSAVRKINELVKRARMCKVHAYIMSHLRDQFGWFGKEKKQKELLQGLLNEFKKVQHKNNLPVSDFPHVGRFKETLELHQISKFPKLDTKWTDAIDDALSHDIPNLMKHLPPTHDGAEKKIQEKVNNPFTIDPDELSPAGSWIIDYARKEKYDNDFHSSGLNSEGKMSGTKAREIMLRSGLSGEILRDIWTLSDIDADGSLDSDEFAVAMFLIEKIKNKEMDIPTRIPTRLVPPSKRHLIKPDPRDSVVAEEPPAVSPPAVNPSSSANVGGGPPQN